MSATAARPFPESPSEGMTRLITVEDELEAILTTPADGARARGWRLCTELEKGSILFFSRTPFEFPDEEREFLLGRRQTSAAIHKNIAYRPGEDRVTGLDKSDAKEVNSLRAILSDYSQRAAEFLEKLLPPYAGKCKLDYASFRPIEERGRAARLRARNDLPHVDAFPTRPTNGDRILRLFTNINPERNRVWITSQTFDVLAPRFARAIGLPRPRGKARLARMLRSLARVAGLPAARRSPYDTFMHLCHNAMKEDADFQASCAKQRWEFPPNSTWIVFTDCVSHAVLEGQYALEQTFIVSRRAMVCPEKSPLAVLEQIAGYSLSDAD
jgi:3-deoxy-D-manno-octulosonic acid hydroxylase-like protein